MMNDCIAKQLLGVYYFIETEEAVADSFADCLGGNNYSFLEFFSNDN